MPTQAKTVELNVGDVVGWILKHRKKKAFLGWTKRDLTLALKKGFIGGVKIACSDCNTISGVVMYEESPEYMILHINNILVTHPKALKMFIQEFRNRYLDWTIQGNRQGILKEYKGNNTDRLLNKLYAKTSI